MSNRIDYEENDIVVPARSSIAAFWNQNGTITLAQPDSEKDNVVAIHPEDVDRVISRLRYLVNTPPEPIE